MTATAGARSANHAATAARFPVQAAAGRGGEDLAAHQLAAAPAARCKSCRYLVTAPGHAIECGTVKFRGEPVTTAAVTAGTVDRVPPRDWRELASCVRADPELFFPDKGERADPAKRVCAGCEVRADCLQHALDRPEWFGVWGGLSERERRKLARLPNPARRCPAHGVELSGGPALWRCPAGHRVTPADLAQVGPAAA